MDRLSAQQRHANMAAIRSKDTKPEMPQGQVTDILMSDRSMKQIEVLCKQSEQVRAVAAIIRKDDKTFATQRGSFLAERWRQVKRQRRR